MSSSEPFRPEELRSERFKQRQAAWKRLRAEFRLSEENGEMKYDRVLGSGGFGIVQKWYTNGPKVQGRDNSVALKTAVNSNKASVVDALKREIHWMKQFTGCEHLVQLVDLPGDTPFENVNNEKCRGMPIIAMEEFGSGSLRILMNRLRMAKSLNGDAPGGTVRGNKAMEYIPNRALWSIFLCLIRGVIGITYPPGDADSSDSRKGKVIRESMKDVLEGTEESMFIHSDIDVMNTFIGYPKGDETNYMNRRRDDSEHVWHPIVKLADYGCMVKWDYRMPRAQRRKSLWGKRAYKSPEQFDPDASFGAHTNIYQIGQIMFDLITLRPIPFAERACVSVEILAGRQSTYGSRLVEARITSRHDWANVDTELREIVAACMSLRYINRPSLEQLETLCVNRIEEMDRCGEAARKGQVPTKPVWEPTPEQVRTMHRFRAPRGMIEPDALLQKFYKEYFVDDWDNSRDRYADYWADDALSSDCFVVDGPATPPPPPQPPVAPRYGGAYLAPFAGRPATPTAAAARLGDYLASVAARRAGPPPAGPRYDGYLAPVAGLPAGPPPPRPPRPRTVSLPDVEVDPMIVDDEGDPIIFDFEADGDDELGNARFW
ncbi:hypothetical protein NPX13_g5173 [Xylaria arbuscula]|uniref:Protein kinase domain-containing protein n=1 Tax=Xylaria arbuscula TaxID=114810 RepID=A0A9W8NFC3_9PEZI|nr:hypothetical protein NPX13_g5173 [Xylaria arbuscula]